MEESVTLFRKSYDELVDIKNSVINIKKEAESEKNSLIFFLGSFIRELVYLDERANPSSKGEILKHTLDLAATNAGYSVEVLTQGGSSIKFGMGNEKITLQSNGRKKS